MSQHSHYSSISIDAQDTQSLRTESTCHRLLIFTGRSKNSAQSPRGQNNETGPDLIGGETNENSSALYTAPEAPNTGKILDLEKLINLCTIRLKIPKPQECFHDDIETGHSKGQATKTKGAVKYLKSLYKAMKSAARSAATPLKVSSSLLPLGRPNDEETEQMTRPSQSTVWSKCFLVMLGPVKSAFDILWGKIATRVTLVPAGLILLWIFTISVASSLIRPLRSLMDLFLPKVALVFSVMAIVGQCWICAIPLAISLASIISQLQVIIDAAFEEMTAVVPSQISKILLKLKIPTVAAEKLCTILFAPFSSVLATIFKIIPKVDSLIPPKVKDPKPLAPFVFIGLLFGLFFAQVLMVLLVGSMLNGSTEILLGSALCWALGWVALQAGNLMPIILQGMETILNTMIQSLLRKLLPISKLQKTIDTAQSLMPKPPKFKRKKKKSKVDTRGSCVESVEQIDQTTLLS